MEGTLGEPIVISDDELLPDAPSPSSSAFVNHKHSTSSHDSSDSNDQSHDRSSSFDASSAPSQIKLRGRKLGDGAGSKRKAEESLSNNPHSKRARARKEQMTETEHEIERAKNADRQAKKRVKEKITQGKDYMAADASGQELLLANAIAKEMDKRYITIIVAIRVLR